MYFNNFSLLFRDRDQDPDSRHCAQSYRGGWWYNACAQGKPTGLQSSTKTDGWHYILWYMGGDRGRNRANSWAEALYELVPN